MLRCAAPVARMVRSVPLSMAAGAMLRAQTATLDYTRNVYPYLGVDWGGNTFVGAALPFGMVKLGPDMESLDGRQSDFGYWSDGRIHGFSHPHLSGTQRKYGNFHVMPVTSPLSTGDHSPAACSEQTVDQRVVSSLAFVPSEF